MLDFVQVVCDHVGTEVAWTRTSCIGSSVAVRESVVNAIKHGNKNDPTRK